MIDIHSHLLPGIDDGAKTLDEAVALAYHAAAHGITHSIITPHIHPGRYDNDCDSILKPFNYCKTKSKNKTLP
ncbi:CpsB/CapC family capsule biosynthesis tyrosine phosphatase [sulfur-oxidizing endosymbiont of Gigantopelta aegis]|uniref:CpsB/CapC family capsule biosynthesis tyrosine phosphatase n=1 Tax=sulfur-oxidizing endosymbiont of Gigantopelta aegis TaxID=2794934 RepID=UPI0018DDED58|nr:CpsB/CapC family capsule biosynthesis tyrosine phosphatase [sulfur-oxidizing endosymbiont of Gigantopelta aegis]